MTTGFSTTNHPNGITNAAIGSTLYSFIDTDPFYAHVYSNDFDTFASGDWTNTHTGSVTNSITAGDGGWLALVNSAANNDLNSLQLTAATFAITAGKQAWFKCRFKTSSATNAALTIGLIPTDTTPLAFTDGVAFTKAAASTTLVATVTASSTSSTLNAATLADNTFIVVGWHYDGGSFVNIFVNDARIGSIPTTNLPSAALNLTMAEANGTAAAITTTIDYIMAATER